MFAAESDAQPVVEASAGAARVVTAVADEDAVANREQSGHGALLRAARRGGYLIPGEEDYTTAGGLRPSRERLTQPEDGCVGHPRVGGLRERLWKDRMHSTLFRLKRHFTKQGACHGRTDRIRMVRVL